MDSRIDFIKLLEMANAFSDGGGHGDEPAKYYDDEIYTTALKAVKSAIPYLHPEMQRQAGLIVKVYELQSLVRMYDAAKLDSRGVYDSSRNEWRKGILTAIRPHLSGENKSRIDLLIKLIDMKELMQAMGGI